jgi:hypothetical protein
VTRCCGQFPAVPQVLLSLAHLPGAHRHSSIVESKHFQCYMSFDFRHGLLVLLGHKHGRSVRCPKRGVS